MGKKEHQLNIKQSTFKNQQKYMSNYKTFLWTILSISVLTSCTYQGSPKDIAEINKVWKTYYNESISQDEKIKLLSLDYKFEYKRIIQAAMTAKESELRKMSFTDKLNILTRRNIIDSLALKPDQLRTFDDAFKRIENTSSFLIQTDQGLNEVLFANDSEAYGVFPVFLSEKSNQFVKEGFGWKINPDKEHPKFKAARFLLQKKYVNEYGSEDAALEEIIKITTGRSPNWQPIVNN